MLSDLEVFAAVILLSLGVTALALATVTALQSLRAARGRTAALALVGAAALVGMASVLWHSTWSEVWNDLVGPLLLVSMAMASGVGLASFIILLLVGSR